MLYFIRSKGAFLSACGNRGKKTVLGFRNVQNAIDIMQFYSECENTSGLMIQKINASSMINMCKNSALDLSIIDSDDSCTYCLEPDKHYIETLTRTFKI